MNANQHPYLILYSTVLVLLATIPGKSQTIQDQCFYSVDIGLSFTSSNSIVNASNPGADMLKFNNGEWEGLGTNANLYNITIEPPVECQHAKAIFFPVPDSNDPKTVGFQLSAPLVTGQFYSFSFTTVSHGYGAEPTFSPDIYTFNNAQFYNGNTIQASFVNDLNAVGAAWNTQNFNFVATAQQNGHNWIFVHANEGSGLLFNFCQINDGVLSDIAIEQEGILCEGADTQLTVDSEAEYYNWSTGENTASINILFPGTYSVTAGNDCNSIAASIEVTMHAMPELNITQDTILCEGFIFPLNAISDDENAQYLWQNGSENSVFNVTEPGTYSVTIQDICFDIEDEVTITYDSIPTVDLGLDTTLCFGQSYFIDAVSNAGNVSYLWNDGLESSDRTITEEGYYQVTLSNQCGSAEDELRVYYSLAPPDIFPGVMGYCAFRELVLNPGLEGSYEWQDGSTDNTYTVYQSGFYYVTIADDDDCFIIRDTVQVVEERCLCPVYVPNSFSPNYDGLNDVFISYHDCDPYDYQLQIFDRSGIEIYATQIPGNGWDGKSGPTEAPSGVYIFRIRYAETHDSLPIEKQGSFSLIR